MKRLTPLLAVFGMVLALAPAAQANPVLPTDGYAGHFRIIFLTAGGFDAIPTDMSVYNTRVENAAAATFGEAINLTWHPYDPANAITGWRMIGSTAATNARVNTGTTATNGKAASGDVPIYNTLGVRVADGNAALWGTTLAPWEDNPPDYYTPNAESLLAHILNETGGTGGSRTWTGTTGSGATQIGDELGAATVAQADNRRRDMGWISWGGTGNPAPNANGYNHYALSPVIWSTNVEIDVTGLGISIPDGDTSPSTDDDTDFVWTFVGGPNIVKTYTVLNPGGADLTLSNLVVSGAGAGQFTAGALTTNVVAGGETATFTVTYTASVERAVHVATVSLYNSDTDENPYSFDITAETLDAGGEINVSGLGVFIPDGDVSPSLDDDTDFAVAVVGGANIVNTYTVENTGAEALTLTNPVVSGDVSRFTAGALTANALAHGETATFTVTYTADTTAAVHNAMVSLDNNDSDENPYSFAITAETVPAGTPIPPLDDFKGDYRLAFVTLGTRDATSADIADYNAFVTAAAAGVPALNALGTTWTCMGSTTTIDARDNTGTLLPADPGYDAANDVPIYTTSGERIADNNADLWGGDIAAGVHFEDGTVTVKNTDAWWAGTMSHGIAWSGQELGTIGNVSFVRGGDAMPDGWLPGPNGDSSGNKHLMALSGVIIGPQGDRGGTLIQAK